MGLKYLIELRALTAGLTENVEFWHAAVGTRATDRHYQCR